MAEFEKLRISLARDDQGPLLEQTQHQESHRSRAAFLAAAFAEERSFLHSRTRRRFDFIPLARLIHQKCPEGLAGVA